MERDQRAAKLGAEMAFPFAGEFHQERLSLNPSV